jgi:hypothetical protein
MSRVIRVLTVLAVVALVLLVPLGLIESRRPPDWQVLLGWYLANQGVSVKALHVEVAEAQRLGPLAAQALRAATTGWTWWGIDHVPLPEWVNCVRIARQEPAKRGTTPSVHGEYIFIGYHNDGQWRAGWLMHRFQAGVSEEEQQDLLDKLGCTNWVEISARTLYQSPARNSPTVVRTPNPIEIFATQTAPTPTPSATSLPTATAIPTNRSDPTAEPTPRERHFPPFVAPLPAELVAPRLG